jgi:hypothetical protein
MYITIVRNSHQQLDVFGVDPDRDNATFGGATYHRDKLDEARAYAQRLADESGTTDIREDLDPYICVLGPDPERHR